MKTNYKKTLILLPLLPLLMANAPARSYVEKPNYDGFEIALISKEATGMTSYGREYYYTFNVKNTGEGYIYNLTYSDNDYQYDYWGIPFGENMDHVFDGVLLAPHHEYTFSFYDRDVDFDKVTFGAFAYTEFVPNEELGGPKTTTVIYESSYQTEIYAEYTILNENEYKYFYTAIITVNYNGVDYSVWTGGRLYYEGREGFCVYSNVPLDTSKLVIPENSCVISRKIREDYIEPSFNVLALGIAVGSVVLMAGIFAAIYFPLKAKKGKTNEK